MHGSVLAEDRTWQRIHSKVRSPRFVCTVCASRRVLLAVYLPPPSLSLFLSPYLCSSSLHTSGDLNGLPGERRNRTRGHEIGRRFYLRPTFESFMLDNSREGNIAKVYFWQIHLTTKEVTLQMIDCRARCTFPTQPKFFCENIKFVAESTIPNTTLTVDKLK